MGGIMGMGTRKCAGDTRREINRGYDRCGRTPSWRTRHADDDEYRFESFTRRDGEWYEMVVRRDGPGMQFGIVHEDGMHGTMLDDDEGLSGIAGKLFA